MAETSYFWSGLVTGDAANAPYDHKEFTKVYNKFFASDGAGYVIPTYANSLDVTQSSPAAASVDVDTGAAMVQGFLYESTAAETLAIAANATGNPRLDRVILRVNFTAQTVRLAILQGTAAASPSLPSLTQAYGTTWEVSLAYIWVANGFATITNTDIHDERVMLHNVAIPPSRNLVQNSEFIAGTNYDGTLVGTFGGVWELMSASGGFLPASLTYTTKPAQQARGRALSLTSNAALANSVSQEISVRSSEKYTFRCPINTASSGAQISVVGNSGGTLFTKTIRRTGSYIDELVRFTTGAADTVVKIIIVGVANANILVGQVTLVEGLRPAEYSPVHEYIPLTLPAVDASWNFTAKSTGITHVDLTAGAWGTQVQLAKGEVSALDMGIGCNDSGSAAGVASLQVVNDTIGVIADAGLKIQLDGVANDKKRYARGIIAIRNSDGSAGGGGPTSTLGFEINVTATGAGTLDALVAIHGIFT